MQATKRILELSAAAALVFGVAAACGGVQMYQYRQADEKPLEKVCSGGFESSDSLLLRSSCGANLMKYTGQAACEAGNGTGCGVAALGALGEGAFTQSMSSGQIQGDPRVAHGFAREGCELDNEPSCLIQAGVLMSTGSRADAARAMQLMDRKCKEGGMPAVCHTIGVAFENNASRKGDRKRAFDYYEQSCRGEFGPGCWKLGKMYEKGFGVSKSQTRAKEKYERACDLNHAKACETIGEERGETQQELLVDRARLSKKAFMTMGRTACKNGFRHACTFVGRLIGRGELRGRYVENSDADSFYELGCEKGAMHSCYFLADRIERRDGPVHALERGEKLAAKACAGGVERSCPLRRDLQASTMDEKEARARTKRCRSGGRESASERDRGVSCYLAAESRARGAGVDEDAEEALALHRIGCEEGRARSCFRVGELLDSGAGEGDPRAAWKRACELGSAEGCHEAALAAEEGSKRALELFEKACDAGHGPACGDLGEFFEEGTNVERDMARAETLHREGCRSGDVEACTNLALLYLEHTQTSESIAEGIALLELSCRRRVGEACTEMALYSLAVEEASFDKTTEEYLERACLLEDGRGCAVFGDGYRNGTFVEEDADKARQLYDQACNYGAGMGCTRLASMYRFGEILERDAEKAESYYRKGCDAGYGRGCKGLAQMVLVDPGVSYEPDRAASLLDEGCGFGHAGSCRELAFLYLENIHVKADPKRSASAFETGCENGAELSCAELADFVRIGLGREADAERADELSKAYATHAKDECEDYERAGACNRYGHYLAHGHPSEPKPGKAREYLRKRCDDGIAGVCREIAELRAEGHIFPRDQDRAVESLRSMCDEGDEKACRQAAFSMRHARSDELEPTRAADYDRKVCDDDDSRSCQALGEAYLHGLGVDRDLERARELLVKSCDRPDGRGCLAYAEALIRAGADDEATSLWKKSREACERHLPTACSTAGTLAAAGYGDGTGLESVAKSYHRACDAGRTHACTVASALDRAAKAAGSLPRPESCGADSAEACVLAGLAADFGIGRERALEEAASLYERGCEAGSARACQMRTALHALERVPMTGDLAIETYRGACEEGDGTYCYAVGSRVGRYLFEAGGELVEKGCRKGEPRACIWLAARGIGQPE